MYKVNFFHDDFTKQESFFSVLMPFVPRKNELVNWSKSSFKVWEVVYLIDDIGIGVNETVIVEVYLKKD